MRLCVGGRHRLDMANVRTQPLVDVMRVGFFILRLRRGKVCVASLVACPIRLDDDIGQRFLLPRHTRVSCMSSIKPCTLPQTPRGHIGTAVSNSTGAGHVVAHWPIARAAVAAAETKPMTDGRSTTTPGPERGQADLRRGELWLCPTSTQADDLFERFQVIHQTLR